MPGDTTRPARARASSATAERRRRAAATPIGCAACGQVITSGSHKRKVRGAHRHRFTNPAGIAYEVGCFREAIGCVVVGPDSVEESWFPGFAWRRAYCGGCRTHLGWCFRGQGATTFFALILARLHPV